MLTVLSYAKFIAPSVIIYIFDLISVPAINIVKTLKDFLNACISYKKVINSRWIIYSFLCPAGDSNYYNCTSTRAND